LGDYCGGNFNGLTDQLSCIQNLGFDAVWISPVVENGEMGYHGYWATNLNEINSHFGSASDLQSLVSAMHDHGIYAMLDVVGNHMGCTGGDCIACGCNQSPSGIVPFNDPAHYHTLCEITDWNDQQQVEICRLANLPDLNQSVPYVRDTLKQWITQMVSTYQFDGIRIDTVPEVDPTFWGEFNDAANCYAVGEVLNGDVNYVAPYQGPLDAVLSYPMFFVLRNVFIHGQSFSSISQLLESYRNQFKDPSLLGTFIDNHDNPRFLSQTGDQFLYQNALTYVLTGQGIPIIYYGTEQGFAGGNDPGNREPMFGQYNQDAPLYIFLQTLLKHRSAVSLANNTVINEHLVNNNCYVYSRGSSLVILTNVGSNYQQLSNTVSNLPAPFNTGTKLCNIFWPTEDCIMVDNNNSVSFTLMHGESKVYTPV